MIKRVYIGDLATGRGLMNGRGGLVPGGDTFGKIHASPAGVEVNDLDLGVIGDGFVLTPASARDFAAKLNRAADECEKEARQ